MQICQRISNNFKPKKLGRLLAYKRSCHQTLKNSKNIVWNYINNSLREKYMNHSRQQLEALLEVLKDPQTAEKIQQYGQRIFNIQRKQIPIITSTLLQEYFAQQSDQIMKLNFEKIDVNKEREVWHPNQFKFFIWILLARCYNQKKESTLLSQQDIEFMQSSFPFKDALYIQYYLLILTKATNKQSRCEWQEDQVTLLSNLIEDKGSQSKWSDIAFLLFCKSNKQFFKTSHQCREKWFNHLNPCLNKEKWTMDEDISLFNEALKYGTKWSKISKQMGGNRTEHMVKNRYKSIFKKYESRFQRCSIKKKIENILKDIQAKHAKMKQQQFSLQKDKLKQTPHPETQELAEVVSIVPQQTNPKLTPHQSFHHIYPVYCELQYQHLEERLQAPGDHSIFLHLQGNNGEIPLIDYSNLEFKTRNKTIFSESVHIN